MNVPFSRLAHCLILIFTFSGVAFAGIDIRNIDTSKWPELRIEAMLPGDSERADDYELTVENKNFVAETLRMIKKIDHADNLLIAVDTSRSLSNEHMEAIRAALGDYVRHLGKDEQMALLSFNDSVQLVAGFTHDKGQVAVAAGQLKQGGKRTELYKAINAGIDLLKNLPGDRSLFIISDGHDEGTGITAEDIVRKANEHGVSLHAVGMPDKASKNVQYLSALDAIARQTNGRYQLAESPLSLSSAIFTLLTARQNSRQADCLYEITFNFKESSFIKAGETQCVLLRKTPNGDERAEFSAKIPESATARQDQDQPEPVPWWQERRYQISLAGVVAALLCLGVIFMLMGRRRKSLEEARLATQHMPVQEEDRESPFVLEFAEMGLSFALPCGRLELGAGRNNAIVLDEPTVSRRHAAITVTPTGCQIEDLNSTNGVEVNGKRIERPVILRPGDKLRFGNAEGIIKHVVSQK